MNTLKDHLQELIEILPWGDKEKIAQIIAGQETLKSINGLTLRIKRDLKCMGAKALVHPKSSWVYAGQKVEIHGIYMIMGDDEPTESDPEFLPGWVEYCVTANHPKFGLTRTTLYGGDLIFDDHNMKWYDPSLKAHRELGHAPILTLKDQPRTIR